MASDSPLPDKATAPTRVEAISDGIFAVGLTLLILDVKVPELALGSSDLGHALIKTLPQMGVYLLSFLAVGYAWIWHNLIFGLIVKSTRALAWINLLCLFPVGVLPFTTALASHYPTSRLASGVYGADLFLYALALNWLWRYAIANDLVWDELNSVIVEQTSQRCAAYAGLSFVALVAGALLPAIGLILFVVIPIFFILTGGRHTAVKEAPRAGS